MKLYTIGFTKKSARRFFELLTDAGVKRVVDVRLNNSSQLAGFAKRDDLSYFLEAVAGIGYVHLPELAPTPDIINEYKKNKGSWADYEKQYLALIKNLDMKELAATFQSGDCLLCSEETPGRCHRRLLAEYLQQTIKRLELHHL